MKPINDLYRVLGLNIQRFRKELNITQEELARRVSLTRTSIVHIESGQQRVTLERLYKIANELDISIYKLLPDRGFEVETSIKLNEEIKQEVLETIKSLELKEDIL